MPISPGETLGPYEILAPIGAGGMGEVWKTRHPRLNHIAATHRRSQAIAIGKQRLS